MLKYTYHLGSSMNTIGRVHVNVKENEDIDHDFLELLYRFNFDFVTLIDNLCNSRLLSR